MKVEKIEHVAIWVNNLEDAAKFFTDLFDVEFSEPHETKETDSRWIGSEVGINLMTPLTTDGPAVRSLERRGEGLAALVLKVPNIEEGISEMKDHGVRLIVRQDHNGTKTALFHPKDLFGVMVELVERE